MFYIGQKKFEEAGNIYKLIIDLSPGDSQAHFYLASIYDESGNREEAVKELNKAIDLDPDYHEALNYLGYVYVEQDKSKDYIISQGFDRKIVEDVIRMVDNNEYKRRQAAPSIKITPKAFVKDRRMPITNKYK